MNNKTYNFKDKAFYEEVWDLLVREAGASKREQDRQNFVYDYCQVEYPVTEYRFMGKIGFGGKFWRNAGEFYISCYREEETPEKTALIRKVNEGIKELVKKHKPSPFPPKA
jgi:hypothetical protein